MDNTIIQQGTFTQPAGPAATVVKNIVLRSDVDWMRVYNYTASAGATANDGCIYYWQRGMPNGGGLYEYHPAADQTLAINALAANTGFFLIDTTDTDPLARVILNGAFVTNATQPVVSTGNTGLLTTGSIVRLSGTTAALSLSGWDFEIDTVVANVSFTMRYAMQQAPGAAATAGYYRHIPYDPIFYPRWRYIVNIQQVGGGNTNAVITTSVQHGYTVGQKIRVNLPDAKFGMTEIHNQEAIVTAATASTITTNIDIAGYTAFTFALPATLPFTMPTIVPIGMDMGTAIAGAVDILADARYNTGYIGMRLMPGVAGPAGDNSDVSYWVAGKSFSNLVE